MKRTFRPAAAVAAVMMLFAAPAVAATSTFHAWTTQITAIEVIGDQAQIDDNCPAGFGERGALLLKSEATVQMESDVYSGPLQTVSDQHCSVPRPPMSQWIDGARKVTPIEMEAGRMVLATADGDQLSLDYRGPGVIKGALFGPNSHTFNGPYTITGGTGIFQGATGHGHLSGEVQATATGFTGGWTMHGTIIVPD